MALLPDRDDPGTGCRDSSRRIFLRRLSSNRFHGRANTGRQGYPEVFGGRETRSGNLQRISNPCGGGTPSWSLARERFTKLYLRRLSHHFPDSPYPFYVTPSRRNANLLADRPSGRSLLSPRKQTSGNRSGRTGCFPVCEQSQRIGS